MYGHEANILETIYLWLQNNNSCIELSSTCLSPDAFPSWYSKHYACKIEADKKIR